MSDNSEDEDEQLLSPAELAVRVGAGPALIQYAIDAGCPTDGGKLSHATFVRWMTDHYNDFRRLVGLPLLPPHEGGTPQQTARTQIANMLMTLTDFISSRSSNLETKAATAEVTKILKERQDT